MRNYLALAACVAGIGCVAALAGQGRAAESGLSAVIAQPVTVSVDVGGAGAAIPEDYLGVSMEIQILLPDAQGKRYFRGDNVALVQTFKTLGVKNLRVGGNTADTPSVPVPGEKDIDDLFAFAKAADVKVIYTLRLRNTTDPTADAAIAKYVMDHYAGQVLYFEIGNEPNIFKTPDGKKITYEGYKQLLSKFIAAIRAPGVAPVAKFCGPNTTGSDDWPARVVKDFGPSGEISLITQHSYVGGNSRSVKDVAAGRDLLLSAGLEKKYEKHWSSFVPAAMAGHVPFRIEETNSFFNGGAKNVSNTHAAALWALDYLHWWASHGAAGLNFHTGDHVAAADEQTPCWYAAYWTSEKGYHVHPVGYAMKAFDVGGHGASVPVTVNGVVQTETPKEATTRGAETQGAGGMNVTAYGVKGADGHLFVTIINKEHGTGGRAATVTLNAAGYSHPEVMTLGAPGGDVAATEGETLGGSGIDDGGKWEGTWTSAEGSTVTVPAATAVVVRMSAGG